MTLVSGIELVGHIVDVANLACSGMRPAGHFCKGTLKDEESTELPVSLVSWKDEFQVSSSGTLTGVRQFWKERHQSIIHNDVRDAVVEVPTAAFGTSSSWPENLAAAKVQSGENVQFFIREVGGAQTQVVR